MGETIDSATLLELAKDAVPADGRHPRPCRRRFRCGVTSDHPHTPNTHVDCDVAVFAEPCEHPTSSCICIFVRQLPSVLSPIYASTHDFPSLPHVSCVKRQLSQPSARAVNFALFLSWSISEAGCS